MFLVEGTPGTGKTTLALQFALEGLKQDERVLYVALSETKRELHEVAASHGWDIGKLDIFEVTPLEASIRPGEEYTVFHSDEVEMAQTIGTILDHTGKVQPSRLIIDSMAELRLLSQDSVRYRRQALALKQHFTSRRVTVLLLDDRTSQNGDQQLHSLVHGVITLERLAREYGKNRRRLEVAKLRGATYAEGFHDYTISPDGITVFPRLASAHQDLSFQRDPVSSGITELDDLLGGGLDRGTSTLILGPAGSGKTTLTLTYCAAAIDRGEPVAMYTFDEGVNSILARGDSLGMNLSRHRRANRFTIEQVNPAELSPGDFADRVRRSVEVDGSKIIIIDSLNGYMTAMPEEEYLSLQMHELLNFLNQRGVLTMLILAQPGIVGPLRTDVDLSYLADNIVMLRFFEANGAVRRAISVVKKRSSSHEQTIREFTIAAPDGVHVGKPLVDFRGVLSGMPEYVGPDDSLSERR